MSEHWTWEFRPRAAKRFNSLEPHIQRRIVSKMDDIINDEWREPHEHIEPLSGLPHGKIRIGEFRLGADADRETNTVVVYDIEHRSGAYTADDD